MTLRLYGDDPVDSSVTDPVSLIPYLGADWYPLPSADPADPADILDGSPHYWNEGGWTCMGGRIYYSPVGSPPTVPPSVFRAINFYNLPEDFRFGDGSGGGTDPPQTILQFEIYDVSCFGETYDGNGGVDLQYLSVQGARWNYELNPNDSFSSCFLPNMTYFTPTNTSGVPTGAAARRVHTGTVGDGLPPFEAVFTIDNQRFRNRTHVHQTFFG